MALSESEADIYINRVIRDNKKGRLKSRMAASDDLWRMGQGLHAAFILQQGKQGNAVFADFAAAD